MRESIEGESGVWVFDLRERDRKMKMKMSLSLSFVFIDDVVFDWQENLRKIMKFSTSFFFFLNLWNWKEKKSSFKKKLELRN